MDVREISYKEAIGFLLPRHYSGRKPQIKYSFGLFEEGEIVAVCTYGVPASRSLCIGVAGEDMSHRVLELNRLCREDGVSSQLSQFVSRTLKMIGNWIVVSYADTAMNHTGAIYQACNFLYTGATKRRTDKYTEGNKHSRHYDKESTTKLRKVRSSKHRYVFFAGSKSFKRKCKNLLRYGVQDYPKGDYTVYTLGEYLEPQIIKEEP